AMEDVTARVLKDAPAGAAPTAVEAAQEAETEKIERECEESSGLKCQVASLSHGGRFQLYKYRRDAPVKLVFAPELQAGFFGGDEDNFTYTRYALNLAL